MKNQIHRPACITCDKTVSYGRVFCSPACRHVSQQDRQLIRVAIRNGYNLTQDDFSKYGWSWHPTKEYKQPPRSYDAGRPGTSCNWVKNLRDKFSAFVCASAKIFLRVEKFLLKLP